LGEYKKGLTVISGQPLCLSEFKWCERGDLNPYTSRCQILSLVRLPISPLSQEA
jgi:hypothetical protein